DRLAPPITTAAITRSSDPAAVVGSPIERNENCSTPATPPHPTAAMYTSSLVRSTGTPHTRAACSLSPTAYARRPKTVYLSTSDITPASTSSSHTAGGRTVHRPESPGFMIAPSQAAPPSGGYTGWSPPRLFARPRR